ncbi:MAG: hypothetical protein M4579_006798 [Chaenotheca gracillima]|nr:MAG: hypothetical protein M4579_006798 [Chaenotheca gracillima]
MASASYYSNGQAYGVDHKGSPMPTSSSVSPVGNEYLDVPLKSQGNPSDRYGVVDNRLKRSIRILRIISRVCNAILSTAVLASLAVVLAKYLSTKNTVRDGRTAWAADTKLWPTVELFAIAAISLFFNLIILMSYCCGVKSANKAATVSSVVAVLIMAGEVIVWAVASSLYRYGKDTNGKSNDLWGWSCSDQADSIQSQFDHVVNLSVYCNVQSGSWYASLIHTGVEIFGFSIYVFVVLRMLNKRRMKGIGGPQPSALGMI